MPEVDGTIGLACPACKITHKQRKLGTRRDEGPVTTCPRCGYQSLSNPTYNLSYDTYTEELDEYPSYTLPAEEVKRRLPTLGNIEDDELREQATELSANAPAYFWAVPASKNHHHEKCQGIHGLWAHTLMVGQAIEDLIWTYESRGFIDETEADYARVAAILHDQRKNGSHTNPSPTAVSDHDLRMAEVIREAGLPEPIADAVAAHMGASYDGPVPEGACLEDLVHMADYWASRPAWTPDLPGPLPREIEGWGFEEAESANQ